jgi:serine/threonine protein kinase/predicted ATPase
MAFELPRSLQSRFEIVRPIGAGAMGMVFEAIDRQHGISVALKTLQKLDPRNLYLFKQEFRSLAEISHPNLVPLYELFSDGNCWFFTMELIDDGIPMLKFLMEGAVAEWTAPEPLEATAPTVPLDARAFQEAGPTPTADCQSSLGELTTHDGPLEPSTQDKPISDGTSSGGVLDQPTTDLPAPASTSEATLDLALGVEQASRGASPAERLQPPKPDLPSLDYDRLRRTFHQLAQGIQSLHEAGKLHRDLKFDNALVRRRDKSVVILDFGLVADLAADWHHEAVGDWEPQSRSPSGSSEYHSQSRSIVGTLPFMSPEQAAARPITTASDWYSLGVMLFRILAGRYPFTEKGRQLLEVKQIKDAPCPSLWRAGIPEDLLLLCRALLTRDPAHRPTGPEVLKCFSSSSTRIDHLASPRLDFPLVGRDGLLASLQHAFDCMVEGQTVVVMLDGVSGVGKTAVIEAALSDFRRRGSPAIFTGKCYEQETVPYKGFDSLIDSLVRNLIPLSTWDRRELIPSKVRALARIFPVLEQLPEVSRLPAVAGGDLVELRAIALASLKELLRRIAKRQPLVLLVDDIQWCDLQSVELIATLVEGPDPLPILLITAHRSEYADDNPILAQFDQIRRRVDPNHVQWTQHTVHPLTAEATRQLALRLLPPTTPDRDRKATWIVEESGGETLFVYELARHLLAGGAISETSGLKLDQILRNRIQKLPEDCRRVLEVLCVAGQPIPYPVAVRAAGYPSRSPTLLKRLKSEHLVRATDRAQQIDSFHDRVRESLLDAIASSRRMACHLEIATQWESYGDAEPETLARHFELGHQIPKAAKYYEAAADRAVQSLAFARADEFFESASRLHADQADRVRIAQKQIHFRSNTTRFQDAYQLGRTTLSELGMKVPTHFQPLPLARELLLNQIRMSGRTVASIESLPEMTDPQIRHSVQILCAMGKAAFQIDPKLCILILAKASNYGLRYGNWPESVIAYMALGCIFYGGILGRHRVGHEYGQLCLKLLEKYDNKLQRPEVEFVVGYFGTAWIRPLYESQHLWNLARQHGRATGDHFHFGCACCADTLSRFLQGSPLVEVQRQGEGWLDELERLGQQEPRDAIRSILLACNSLQSECQGSQNTASASLRQTLQGRMAEFSSRHFAHYFFLTQMIVAYHRRDWKEATRYCNLSGEYQADSQGMLHHAEHRFYEALIESRAQRDSIQKTVGRKPRKLLAINRFFSKLAAQCPENFQLRSLLLEAEVAATARRLDQSINLWHRVGKQTEDLQQWHLQAIAWRRLADHAGPDDRIAYLQRAADAYRMWGASWIAASLESLRADQSDQSIT